MSGEHASELHAAWERAATRRDSLVGEPTGEGRLESVGIDGIRLLASGLDVECDVVDELGDGYAYQAVQGAYRRALAGEPIDHLIGSSVKGALAFGLVVGLMLAEEHARRQAA